MATISKYGFLIFAKSFLLERVTCSWGLGCHRHTCSMPFMAFLPLLFIFFFFLMLVCAVDRKSDHETAARLINTTSDQSQTFEAQARISFFNL